MPCWTTHLKNPMYTRHCESHIARAVMIAVTCRYMHELEGALKQLFSPTPSYCSPSTVPFPLPLPLPLPDPWAFARAHRPSSINASTKLLSISPPRFFAATPLQTPEQTHPLLTTAVSASKEPSKFFAVRPPSSEMARVYALVSLTKVSKRTPTPCS